MDTNKILTSNYLDLVFDGRNKAYGSYELRKTYPQRMRHAGAFLLMTACLALGYKVMAEHTGNKPVIALPPILISTTPIDITPPKPEPPIDLPKPSAPAAPVNTVKFPPPVITPDEVATETMASQKQLEHAVAGNVTIDGDSSGTASPDLVVPGGTGTGGPAVVDRTGGTGGSSNEPFKFVEQAPEFPGGDKMMYQYLSEHLRYPDAAYNAGQQGSVRVRFVVNEDGSITNVETTRGFGFGSEQEAIRVVSGMPRWKPGKNNGKAVKVWFQLPVTFQMGN